MSEKKPIIMDSFSYVDKRISCQFGQAAILLCVVSIFYTSLLGYLFFDSSISVCVQRYLILIFHWRASNLVSAYQNSNA